jgi:hypothetical protein
LAVFAVIGSVDCSQAETGADRNASPTMPFRMPIEVMPIWIVDRKRVGSRANASAEAASLSPCLALVSRRGLRAVSSATSDMANAPFKRMRLARRRSSMDYSIQPRPSSTSSTKRLPT